MISISIVVKSFKIIILFFPCMCAGGVRGECCVTTRNTPKPLMCCPHSDAGAVSRDGAAHCHLMARASKERVAGKWS